MAGKSKGPKSGKPTGDKKEPKKPSASAKADSDAPKEPVKFTPEQLKNMKVEIKPGQPLLSDTFTAENVGRFLLGEITWGNLIGMSQEDAQGFAEYAYKQFVGGRYHDAKKIFEGLVMINPYSSYYHAMYGACLQVLDEREAAMDEYSTAIKLDSTNIQALVNRAELFLRTANFQPALDDLTRVVELDPESKDPATMRARALAAATSQTLMMLADLVAEAKKKT